MARHREYNEQIRNWIDFALSRNDVAYLSNVIHVGWNERFTCKFADAAYKSRPPRGRIRISPKIWERAMPEQRREVIVHETAHIVAYHLHGTGIKPHGVEWRQAMANCGVEPEVTHDINLLGINVFHVRDCPKAERCCVSRRDFAGLKRGGHLHCTICGMRVESASVET